MRKGDNGKLFGYVQSDIDGPENLRSNFAGIRPFFKTFSVSKNDMGDIITNYAEEGVFLSQPRKRLISSFKLGSGTFINPFFFILN